MKLYIVPTPIGNLKDITYRAIDVLNDVDLILAEDTRKTKFLLNHFEIKTMLQSFHKFNEHKKIEQFIDKIKLGITIALVSDAGTPGISDPGFLLIREAVKNNISVETLPGATAFIPALVNSGLPCDRFIFEGFLPHKKGKQKKIAELADQTRTMVFYESPYRILKTLADFSEHFGEDRRICVSRELTKIHEENVRGTIKEVYAYFEQKKIKGEFVVIVEGKSKKAS